MTVHVLIPVFNRLELTRRVIKCLRDQKLDDQIRLIVIDDGSTDGTSQYLKAETDISVLNGDGTLWWGGAINLGLMHVLQDGKASDWVLLVNNDTEFDESFVQRLLDVARVHAPAVVGSVICDASDPERLLSVGAVLDTWRLRVQDKLETDRERCLTKAPHVVDALSGRGTLYPISAFYRAGTMRPAWLPHYLADYELAVRVKKAGFKLLVTENAAVLSGNEFGNSYESGNLGEKLFSARSACYLPAVFAFWWSASSLVGKFTLLPRFFIKGLRSVELTA